MTAWLRYVAFADIPSYIAKGWTVIGTLGGNHGHYAVLMQWTGEGEPS